MEVLTKDEVTYYHTPAKEDYMSLMDEVEKLGYKLDVGHKRPTKMHRWNVYEEDTIVILNNLAKLVNYVSIDDLVESGRAINVITWKLISPTKANDIEKTYNDYSLEKIYHVKTYNDYSHLMKTLSSQGYSLSLIEESKDSDKLWRWHKYTANTVIFVVKGHSKLMYGSIKDLSEDEMSIVEVFSQTKQTAYIVRSKRDFIDLVDKIGYRTPEGTPSINSLWSAFSGEIAVVPHPNEIVTFHTRIELDSNEYDIQLYHKITNTDYRNSTKIVDIVMKEDIENGLEIVYTVSTAGSDWIELTWIQNGLRQSKGMSADEANENIVNHKWFLLPLTDNPIFGEL